MALAIRKDRIVNMSAIIAQEMDFIHLEIGEQNLNLVWSADVKSPFVIYDEGASTVSLGFTGRLDVEHR